MSNKVAVSSLFKWRKKLQKFYRIDTSAFFDTSAVKWSSLLTVDGGRAVDGLGDDDGLVDPARSMAWV